MRLTFNPGPIRRRGLPRSRYVARPSQITRSRPSSRLQMRRRINLGRGAPGLFPNPSALLKWNTYAGGTSALEGKHAYDARMPEGEFHIWPPEQRGGGYKLQAFGFGESWRSHGIFRSPQAAKSAAEKLYLQLKDTPGARMYAESMAKRLKENPRERKGFGTFIILRGHKSKKDHAIFNAGKSTMKELRNAARKLAAQKGEAIEIHRERRLKSNPAPRDGKIADAARLLKDFTGHDARSVRGVRLPQDSAGLAIGPVLAVAYETTRDGKREKYLHEFRRGARPLLAASSDGRSLFMLGGAYRFTERGIVDKG